MRKNKAEVMLMLFRKKVEKVCAYCQYCTLLEEDAVLCTKKGLRQLTDKCRKFKYDPCKRIPAKQKALDLEKYKEYDYSL